MGFVQKFLRRHGRLILVGGILYSLVFMYFQQTLLIDFLSLTSTGPFYLRLPPGLSYVVSTTPPIPESSMPFPLWGPFLSVTTNYFDVALTPLSVAITASTAFLVMFVTAAYLDIYRSVKQNLASRKATSFVQSLSLIGTFLSCTCEFFEGLLAAVEPAASILVPVAGLLAAMDESFLLVALSILGISAVLLTLRMHGTDLLKNPVKEVIWPIIFVPPFLVFLVQARAGDATLLIVGGLALITLFLGYALRNWRLTTLSVPVAGYYAANLESARFAPHYAIFMSTLIGAILAAVVFSGRKIDKLTLAVTLALTAFLFIYGSYAWIAYLTGVALSIFTYSSNQSPRKLITYQAVTWVPVMLGPLAIAYRPLIPLPGLDLDSQVFLYVYVWLVATPVTWFLGLKAIFILLEKAGLSRVTFEQPVYVETTRANGARLPALSYMVLGVAAILSQLLLFTYRPQLFLVASIATQKMSDVISALSLTMIVAGTLLFSYGVYSYVVNSGGSLSRGIRFLVNDKATRGVFTLTFTAYLVFSLLAVGSIALGGLAPPGIAFPSYSFFTAGAPPLYVPSMTVYITRGFGLVLVPEHLYVALITAYLVAFSFRALFRLRLSRRARGASVAATMPIVALACPTCTITSASTLLALGSVDTGVTIGILASPTVNYSILAASWLALIVTVAYCARLIGRRYLADAQSDCGTYERN
ncbi:MAG: hypothetical protein M1357_03355 [Candidatus Marsarchaeota archaeon]|nr:hypothetical protein [Candidatus Marsarchaeota archaeon]